MTNTITSVLKTGCGKFKNYCNTKSVHLQARYSSIFVLDDKISFGKAAELLGIEKIRYITDLGKAGLPYFEQPFDEVLADAKAANPPSLRA